MTPPPNPNSPSSTTSGLSIPLSGGLLSPGAGVSQPETNSALRLDAQGNLEAVTTRPLPGPFYFQTTQDSRGRLGWSVGIDLFKAFPDRDLKPRAAASKSVAAPKLLGAVALEAGLKAFAAAAFDYLQKQLGF